jgi:hypothetical protein
MARVFPAASTAVGADPHHVPTRSHRVLGVDTVPRRRDHQGTGSAARRPRLRAPRRGTVLATFRQMSSIDIAACVDQVVEVGEVAVLSRRTAPTVVLPEPISPTSTNAHSAPGTHARAEAR